MVDLIFLIVYGLSLITCLRIAFSVYEDDWNDYVIGGSGEGLLMIFIGLIPIFNTIVSLILGGIYYIKKLKKKKKRKNGK